jgi:structural maintenance of chromosome 1
MDAIAFVLGEKSKAIRGANLRELVYDGAQAQAARLAPGPGGPGGGGGGGGPLKCHVTLVYRDADGTEVHFTRGIVGAGGPLSAAVSTEYRLDGALVSYDAYDAALQQRGILLRARNFLVYQGDVESIASKSPKELSSLFELVSGSASFVGDYTAAEAAKAAAETATSVAFQKRKGAAAQKRQKKEQKEEADKAQQLAGELGELRLKRALFALCHLEAQAQALQEQVAEATTALAQAQARHTHAQQQLASKKKDAAGTAKSVALADKALAKATHAAEALQPGAAEAQQKADRCGAKLKAAQKLLAAAQGADADNTAEIAKLREKLEQLDAVASEETAAAAAAASAGSRAQLTPALREEYAGVSAEAAERTVGLRRDLTAATRELESERDVATALAAKLAELDDNVQRLSKSIEEHSARQEALQASVQEATAAVKDANAAVEAAKGETRRVRLKAEGLDAKLRDTDAAVASERASRRETEREHKIAEAIAALARCFPGVRGRLTDCTTVPDKRHRVAVQVALGRWADAVVVDDDAVARQCIAHLKEQRLERLTFIPLRNVRAQAVDERLRQLGGTSRLVLDVCVPASSEVERALLYALGNTLLCDSHEEAKKLAFDTGNRRKVVSLDGTLCAAWGGITGGASGGTAEAGSTRFDRAAYEQLKATKAQLEAERASLASARECADREHGASQTAQAAQRTLAALQGDVAATTQRASGAKAQRTALLKERAKLAPQLVAAQAAQGQRDEMVAATKGRMDDITDRICAAFCAKVGVANIRVFEEQFLRADKRTMDARARHAKHRAELAETLNLRMAKDTAGAVARAQAALNAAQADAATLQAAKQASEAQQTGAQQAVTAAQKEASTARSAAAAADEEVSALQRSVSALTDDLGTAKRAVASKQAAVEAVSEKIDGQLRQCAVEGIKLPRLAGQGEEEEDGELGPSPDVAAMDEDGDGAGPSTAPSASHAAHRRRIDFSGLPRGMRVAAEAGGAKGAAERERLLAELAADVDAKQAVLEQLAPNLKAVTQYEAMKEREKELSDELEAAKEASKAAADAFAEKRQERYAAFMAAFTHVAGVVDPIYKALTRSDAHPYGGSAELMLENPNEPFLHGVRYIAMPPTKRFRDMEQLSGGEKTVAALALLFAIHSYRPSPFFVLDEVDAALDRTNVERVARFVMEAARAVGSSGNTASGMRPFQSLVISLKDSLYDKGDALVGVYRDTDTGSSRTLTLDLAKYADGE